MDDDIDVCGGTVKSGALLPLWALGSRTPELAGMRDDTPALTCKIDASLADFIASRKDEGQLSLGWFETRQPYFIRLRYRDVEIYWLVDHSDPEIWETVRRWTLAGRVPISFETSGAEKRKSLIVTADMPEDTDPFERCYGGGEEASTHMWICLTALAGNGNWQYDEEDGEIYDIWTVPLRHSLFRVLLTRRWEEYLRHRDDVPVDAD
ncbi:hypothetical protein [Paraburkholderia phenoliruptrix]|uniref:hypothetical protein n=1 Tax=Paraburkholderia phenoliruptrix TaxID=252970 RepID=UPI002869C0AA|nr:hypothetical protein [Paraburkholderia phenoliruptrix]WMY10896.1 hypothetical protein P3F88_29890 [Paraburkholderia phenoliruptrix]